MSTRMPSERLEAAGFEQRYQSSLSEARYFGWPGRPHVLRVSAHKSKKGPIGMPQVVAKITFFDKACEVPLHIRCNELLTCKSLSLFGQPQLHHLRPLLGHHFIHRNPARLKLCP
jgi:hypothetical protein